MSFAMLSSCPGTSLFWRRGVQHLVSRGLPGGSHVLPQRLCSAHNRGEGSFSDALSVLGHFRARLSLRCFRLLFRGVVSAVFRSWGMVVDIFRPHEPYSASWSGEGFHLSQLVQKITHHRVAIVGNARRRRSSVDLFVSNTDTPQDTETKTRQARCRWGGEKGEKSLTINKRLILLFVRSSFTCETSVRMPQVCTFQRGDETTKNNGRECGKRWFSRTAGLFFFS